MAGCTTIQKVSLFRRKEMLAGNGCVFRGDKFKEIPIKQTNSIPAELPDEVQDGYTLDWPSGSLISLNSILGESKWNGLFLTLTMGYQDRPCFMTALKAQHIGYWKHQMITDILAQPGGAGHYLPSVLGSSYGKHESSWL